MTPAHLIQISAFLALAAFSSYSHAINCHAESEGHKSEGDKYFDIDDSATLSSRQKIQISQFFDKFSGKRLKGTGKFTECVGPESEARKQVSEQKLEAKISVLSDSTILISTEIYDISRKSLRNETYRYFDYGSHQVIKTINAHGMSIVSKFRKSSPTNAASIFVEEVTDFKASGNTLYITITRYHTGYFSTRSTMQLFL